MSSAVDKESLYCNGDSESFHVLVLVSNILTATCIWAAKICNIRLWRPGWR